MTQIHAYIPTGNDPAENINALGVGWTFTDSGIEARTVAHFPREEWATEEAFDSLISKLTVANWTDTTRQQDGLTFILDGSTTYDAMLKDDP